MERLADAPVRQVTHANRLGDGVHTLATRRVTWSVRRSGSGPVALLLHGMGAAKHSWETVTPSLNSALTLVVPDLPGHGDSRIEHRSVVSLPDMAFELSQLMRSMSVSPQLIVGHSAGAAIAVRMVLDGHAHPKGIVSINGAFMTYGGSVGRFLAPLAGLLSSSRWVTDSLARKARNPAAVERVIAGTGSSLDAAAVARYSKVLQNPSHMAATFAMMSNWDLTSLRRDVRRLNVPLRLLAAERDGAVDPEQAEAIAQRCAVARVRRLPGLGHVAHEEDPAHLAQLILQEARATGVLAA